MKRHLRRLLVSLVLVIAPAVPHSKTAFAQSSGDILSELRNGFRLKRATEVDQPFETAAASLKENFAGALEREFAKVTATGDLEAALAVKAELEALATTPVGEEPVTPPTTETLKKMRELYRGALEPLRQGRDANLLRLARAFLPEVEKAEQALTKSGDLDGALNVRAYRESLAAEFPAPAQAAPPGTPRAPIGAASRMTAGGHEIFDPVGIECVYGGPPSSSGGDSIREEHYILEADEGKGRLRLEFADPRFEETPDAVEQVTLRCRVATVANADTSDVIGVLYKGERVGSQAGARKGAELEIVLDKKVVGGPNPLRLEVVCGRNAVILEATASKRPYLTVKFR